LSCSGRPSTDAAIQIAQKETLTFLEKVRKEYEQQNKTADVNQSSTVEEKPLPVPEKNGPKRSVSRKSK
jgi:hypothetical protein